MTWKSVKLLHNGDFVVARVIADDGRERQLDLSRHGAEEMQLGARLTLAATGESSAVVLGDPASITLDIASACNMRCSFCPYHGEHVDPDFRPDRKFMDLDLLERILAAFPNVPAFGVGGTGEPLLHRDLVEIFRRIHARAPLSTAALWTNGLALDRFDLDELLGEPGLTKINFSIDTLDAGEHTAWSRREGSLETVLEHLQRTCDWRRRHRPRHGDRPLEVIVSFVIRRSAFSLVEQAIAFFQAYDIDYLGFQNFIPETGDLAETLTTGDAAGCVRLEQLYASVSSRFAVGLPQPLDLERARSFCAQPWNHLDVDADGHVSPCCNVPRHARHGRFEGRATWNGKAKKQARAAFREGRNPVPKCSSCWANEDPSRRLYIRPTSQFALERADRPPAPGRVRADHARANAARAALWQANSGKQAVVPHGPRKLGLGVTAACNFACDFCIFHGPSLKAGGTAPGYARSRMSVEDVKRIFTTYWPEHVAFGVTGEAFLHPDLGEIFEYLGQYDVRVTASTNASAPRFLETMDGHGHLVAGLNVSLDATTREEYARLGPGADLDRTVRVLGDLDRMIVERGWNLPLEMNFVIEAGPGWEDRIRRAVALTGSLELASLRVVRLNNCVGFDDAIDRTLTARHAPSLEKLAAELTGCGPYPFAVELPILLEPGLPNTCRDPWVMLSIGPDGSAAPCCREVPAPGFGNVLAQGPLPWNGEALVLARERLIHGLDPFRTCLTCPSRGNRRHVIPAGVHELAEAR